MYTGASVAFYCSKDYGVSLSFTEAEYVAMATGSRVTIFMRRVWHDISADDDIGCTTLKEKYRSGDGFGEGTTTATPHGDGNVIRP